LTKAIDGTCGEGKILIEEGDEVEITLKTGLKTSKLSGVQAELVEWKAQ